MIEDLHILKVVIYFFNVFEISLNLNPLILSIDPSRGSGRIVGCIEVKKLFFNILTLHTQ